MEVRLEQHVNVHPLPDIATVAHVARHGIESIQALCDAALNCEPRGEVSHVIDTGHCRRDLLLDLVRAEVAVLVEKLRGMDRPDRRASVRDRVAVVTALPFFAPLKSEPYNVRSAAAAFAIAFVRYCE